MKHKAEQTDSITQLSAPALPSSMHVLTPHASRFPPAACRQVCAATPSCSLLRAPSYMTYVTLWLFGHHTQLAFPLCLIPSCSLQDVVFPLYD
jgi:hypothetical protein